MQARSVEHETITIERDFKAAPQRVFAAWASPEARAQWMVPNDQWESGEQGNDFRVGGREVSRFGPKGNPRYRADTSYLDIVADRRIIMAGTMYDADQPISCSLATVEFLSAGRGTRMLYRAGSIPGWTRHRLDTAPRLEDQSRQIGRVCRRQPPETTHGEVKS